MEYDFRREKLLDYILRGMDKYYFDRGLYNGKVMGFTDYQQFVNKQRSIIYDYDKHSLNTLEELRDLLIPRFKIMDKGRYAYLEGEWICL